MEEKIPDCLHLAGLSTDKEYGKMPYGVFVNDGRSLPYSIVLLIATVEFRITIQIFARFNLNELDTTLTELNAIAAAANIGLRSPRAATGIPIIL
jgi:hypothetical protein